MQSLTYRHAAWRCGWIGPEGKCQQKRENRAGATSCPEHRCTATYRDELGDRRCPRKAEHNRGVCRQHRFHPAAVPAFHHRCPDELPLPQMTAGQP